MGATKRLALAVSLALCEVAYLAGPATAAALPAGSFRITTINASTGFFDPDTFAQTSIFVTDTVTESKPLLGPSTVTTEVDVNVSWSTEDTFGSGCSILSNPSDFSFSSDLTAAALHTTLTDSMQPCAGYPDAAPPVAIDVVWSGPGSGKSRGQTETRFDCAGYSTETMTTGASATATATATLSILLAPFTDTQATLRLNEDRVHAQGSAPPTCVLPGNRGVGHGPLAPGGYDFSSIHAGFSPSADEQSDPQLSLFVNDFTNVFNPIGRASSTTKEIDLVIQVSGGEAGFAVACFVLGTSDFTMNGDLSSASVHTALSSDTPTCQPSFGDFPYLPTTVDVAWTGIGPVATTRTDVQSPCMLSSSVSRINPASATATLSVFPGMSFAGSLSALATSDDRFQILSAPPCLP